MPGRLDAIEGTLGKRKRLDDLSDTNAFDLKNKASAFVKPDQMAMDAALSDMHTFNHINYPPPHQPANDQQPPPRARRKLAQPRAVRVNPPSHSSTSLATKSKSTIQTPCHRCHKTPLQKKDLESFTDCVRCQERTCLVCLRQCGCHKKICADCSVEEGVDGDVYCLDCFAKIQDDGTHQHHHQEQRYPDLCKDEDREMHD